MRTVNRWVRVVCLLVTTVAAARAHDCVLASVPAGECTLQLEAARTEPALRARAVHPQMKACAVEEAALVAMLESGFARVGADSDGPVYTSLALGRLIDYPWMARELAAAAARDPRWDARRGKPMGGDVNRYAAGILGRPEGLAALDGPLRRNGYRIAGVSVEKVLVGAGTNLAGWDGPPPEGKLPLDAQVWLRLERVQRIDPFARGGRSP